jgi:NHLM bacteriocin system secretion protein
MTETNRENQLTHQELSSVKEASPDNDNLKEDNSSTQISKKTPVLIRTLPLIVLTTAFLGWSFLAQVPVKVVGQSIVLVPRSRVNFWSRSSGRVVSLKIKPGDKVVKGQVLAVIEATELREKLLTQQQQLAEYGTENIAITEIEDQRSLLKRESIKRQKETIPIQIEANNQQIESNQQERIAITRQRKTYQQRLKQIDEIDKLIAARFEGYNELVEEGAVAPLDSSRIQAEDVLQKNLNEKTQLLAKLEDLTAKDEQLVSQNESLKAQNQNLQAQLENLASQEAEISLDDLESETKRINTIDNLKREIENTKVQLSNQSQVVSQYDGEIMEINVNLGQFVSTGTSIGRLQLQPSPNSEKIALAFFTPENADRINSGMKVAVTPNLLTERRFGGARERFGGIVGTVKNVSQETITPEEVTSLVGNSQLAEALMTNPVPYSTPDPGEAENLPVVQVEIALERDPDSVTGFKWDGGKEPTVPIPEGAIGEARVTVEKRSPVNYLMPLLRWITGIYS